MEPGIDHLSMFMLGLLGSGHCLGMCGPLVIALPGRYGRWSAHGVYHLGRLNTYCAIGAALGGINQGLVQLAGGSSQAALVWTVRMQVVLSLFAALFLLLMGLNRIGLLKEPAWMAVASPQKIPGYNTLLKHSLDRRNLLWLFGMGLMLGLLPCGLSYGAFSRSLAAGNLITGIRASSITEGCCLDYRGHPVPRVHTFADVPVGSPLCYENSNGLLEIALNQGRAVDYFMASVGDELTLCD